jgi:biotin carboxyl carrier protein
MAQHIWKVGDEIVETKTGAKISWENDTFFRVYFQGKTFFGEVESIDTERGLMDVKINHRSFSIKRELPIHQLLSELGLDKVAEKKLDELKSPMPGKVLAINVKPGDEVRTGTSLLTLEAMKMENVIKAEGVGIVKSIHVDINQTADKGMLLIKFE